MIVTRNGFLTEDWHLWFAWRPVLTREGKLCWLRKVKRRFYTDGGADSVVYREYKEK